MKASSGPRSIEEWGRLLEIDPVLLTPADAEWFEHEDQWIASARALMDEVLGETPDAQWALAAEGDA